MESKTRQSKNSSIAGTAASGSSAQPLRWARPASEQGEQAALLLAAIVESIDDAIISLDLSGTVTSWNQGAERIFGYKSDEMIGQPLRSITPEEFRDDESWILAEIKSGKTPGRLETVRLHKNGDLVPVSLTISPIKTQQTVIGAAVILRDITEQKQVDQAAFQLAAIVESSEDAIISKNLNGIVASWNKAAERILGYAAGEMVGQSITRIIPQELQDEELRILAKIRAGERINHFQTVRVHKNGDRLDVSLTISPVRDEHGTIVGAAKILRDVTQQKKLEEALQMSERLASAGRLAATIAHEINNPLESVTNFIYLAKQEPGISMELRGYLDVADQELARVAHVAQQTLGFYRDNSQPASFVVSEVVADALFLYDRKLKYKNISVESQFDAGLTLRTFPGEFKQVVLNLLANAIDASGEGGRILIRSRASRHFRSGRPGIRLTVADAGKGIAEKDKPRLFKPFFTTKKNVGTGLGLWITKDLLEKRGGQIRFRSRTSEPSGTAMSIYLPADLPAAEPVNSSQSHSSNDNKRI